MCLCLCLCEYMCICVFMHVCACCIPGNTSYLDSLDPRSQKISKSGFPKLSPQSPPLPALWLYWCLPWEGPACGLGWSRGSCPALSLSSSLSLILTHQFSSLKRLLASEIQGLVCVKESGVFCGCGPGCTFELERMPLGHIVRVASLRKQLLYLPQQCYMPPCASWSHQTR